MLWLLEELGLEYRVQQYARTDAGRAPPELEKVHPLGRAPIVTLDGEAHVESGAILELLLDRFGEGRLRPEVGTPEHLRYRFFLHYAEGSLMPPLLILVLFQKLKRESPLLLRPLAGGIASAVDGAYTLPELRRHLAYLDRELSDRPFFAGSELTAADVQMIFPVETAVEQTELASGHRHLLGWYDRVQERPAFLRALDRAGDTMTTT